MIKEKFIISSPILYSPFPNYFTDGKTGKGLGSADWSKEKHEAYLFNCYEDAYDKIKTFSDEGWFQVEKIFIV